MLEDMHRVCDVCRDAVAENGFTMWVTEAIETRTLSPCQWSLSLRVFRCKSKVVGGAMWVPGVIVCFLTMVYLPWTAVP